ncbi:HAD-IIA family hydrolase [Gracilibacillus sp. YIM 98692]|uniref:HAD-IIA family hydrolase n=1 Tax=Gracilibacillus sp. YIM 98692 TaxID=2663532 RepID=UPI0013D48D0C|nr:HAD-IIA family hydrolase [Gracilibacillus sp. YIM 98692]
MGKLGNHGCINALKSVEAFFFDLDGCIYHTNQPAPGAKEMLTLLRQEGKKVGFITNNSRQTGEEITEKLRKMDLMVSPEEIVTATEMTGAYLKEKYGLLTVKVIGSKGLEQSLERWGHKVVGLKNHVMVDAIVIGRDTAFTFDKIQLIEELESKGVRIVSTNPDLYHPGSRGNRVPETGALVAAIEAIIGKTVEYVGKPNPYLFQFAMEFFGTKAVHSVMVGDNLNTDITGAVQAGMKTAWIRGAGMDQALDVRDKFIAKPDVIVDQMEELLAYYREYIMMATSEGK